MASKIVKHILGFILAIMLIFLLTLGLPDATYQVAGAFANATVLDHIRKEYGLDGDALTRLESFGRGLARGELRSLYTQELVIPILIEKIPQSMAVVASASVLSVLIGSGLAVLMAVSKRFRVIVSSFVGMAATVPVFVTSTLLLFMSSRIAAPLWLYAGISLAVFPGILLSTSIFGVWREARSASHSILSWHYGLRGFAQVPRFIRAAPGTMAVFINAMIFFVATGLIVVEPLFGISGIGRWLLVSALRLDMPVILFIGTVLSAVAIALGLLRDLLLFYTMPGPLRSENL
ncbi:MAG: hypothetical protein V1806_07635 [Pseudomonadota bacterium]